jgi:rhodanese-related sulfurtransferase
MPYFVQFLIDNWFIVIPLIVSIVVFLRIEKVRKASILDPQQVIFYLNRKNAMLIDIRNSKEFSEGKISQAKHIGPDIDLCKKEINKSSEKPIIIICQNGNYSLRMAADLKKENINVFTMKGGINSWRGENLPLIS